MTVLAFVVIIVVGLATLVGVGMASNRLSRLQAAVAELLSRWLNAGARRLDELGRRQEGVIHRQDRFDVVQTEHLGETRAIAEQLGREASALRQELAELRQAVDQLAGESTVPAYLATVFPGFNVIFPGELIPGTAGGEQLATLVLRDYLDAVRAVGFTVLRSSRRAGGWRFWFGRVGTAEDGADDRARALSAEAQRALSQVASMKRQSPPPADAATRRLAGSLVESGGGGAYLGMLAVIADEAGAEVVAIRPEDLVDGLGIREGARLIDALRSEPASDHRVRITGPAGPVERTTIVPSDPSPDPAWQPAGRSTILPTGLTRSASDPDPPGRSNPGIGLR